MPRTTAATSRLRAIGLTSATDRRARRGARSHQAPLRVYLFNRYRDRYRYRNRYRDRYRSGSGTGAGTGSGSGNGTGPVPVQL